METLEEPEVKRTIFICIILLVVATGILSAEDSRMFVKTMPITKIYSHRLGFRVLYYKNDLSFGEFYVPLKWFDEAGGREQRENAPQRGVIIFGNDNAYPFFSIFWFDGQFHSIKLYVKQDLRDPSWGDIPTTADVEENFNIEALQIEF